MQRLILAALFALALSAFAAEPAAAARDFGEFPEVSDVADGPITNFQTGPGFYLSWVKLLVLWILFLLWVRSCDWIGRDAQQLRLDYRRWSLLVFFLFAPLLLAMFLLPWFWPVYAVAWLAYLVPFVVYVKYRNARVTVDETVFTPGHIRFWLSETLRPLGIKIEAERVKKKGPDIELVAKGGDSDRTNTANLLAARQSPAFPLVLELLDDAVRRRADAVLMDYSQTGVSMKYQIDGVWHDVEPRDRETGDPMLAVIKTVSALNPKERVKPQRGEFGAVREKAKLAFKVASQGAKTGERVLVQFANGQVKGDRLPQLDMRDKMVEQFKQLLEQPGGLIVISAPGASGGLTTLLNATVGSMDRFVRGFVGVEAVEKPEVDVENVPITKYKAAAGETPMTVLPKLLREHPDVLVVADMVDAETAELLLDQAIDQHRTIVTSVRAKEASEALLRMLLLKAPIAKYAESVRAVLNQRMIRKLCEKCKEGYQPPAKVMQQLGIPPGRIEALYRPPQEPEQVCEACGGVGYVGRTAIFELLVVNDEVRQALLTSPQLATVRQAARRGGMRTLQEEGVVLVARGVTSLPELMRVLKEQTPSHAEDRIEMLAIILPAVALLIIVVMLATIGGDGVWSNTITLFNLVVAGLLATNFWEPTVRLLMEKATPRAVYTWDIVALWLLFAIFYSLLRVFTDLLSKHRLRLPKPLDIAGGYVMSIWIGWVFVCFTMFTLHTAPLSREFLGGGFKAETPMIFGMAPDRQWLAFMQKASLGPLSRMASDSDPEQYVFDSDGEFMLRYATRRDRFAAEDGFLTKE